VQEGGRPQQFASRESLWDWPIFRLHVSRNPEIEPRNGELQDPVTNWCLECGPETRVEFLLKWELDSQNPAKSWGCVMSRTPVDGHLEVVRVLLDASAAVNQATTDDGTTPPP
jgi:hypothetical protein